MKTTETFCLTNCSVWRVSGAPLLRSIGESSKVDMPRALVAALALRAAAGVRLIVSDRWLVDHVTGPRLARYRLPDKVHREISKLRFSKARSEVQENI